MKVSVLAIVFGLLLVRYVFCLWRNRRFYRKADSLLGKEIELESDRYGRQKFYVFRVDRAPTYESGRTMWWWPWAYAHLRYRRVEDIEFRNGQEHGKPGTSWWEVNIKSSRTWEESLEYLGNFIDEAESMGRKVKKWY